MLDRREKAYLTLLNNLNNNLKDMKKEIITKEILDHIGKSLLPFQVFSVFMITIIVIVRIWLIFREILRVVLSFY